MATNCVSRRSQVSKPQHWLIGDSILSSLSEDNRLATKGAVMARFRNKNKFALTREIFREIFEELKLLWQKAGIPIKANCNCVNEMVSLHEKWKNIKKIPNGKRNTALAVNRIESFKSTLNEILDLSPENVEEKLKQNRKRNAAEDYQFLLGQREIPQRGYMEKIDRKNLERELNRQKRSCTPALKPQENSRDPVDIESGETEEELELSSFGDEYTAVTPRPSSITLELPSRNIIKVTSQAADARDLSVRDHVAILASTIRAGGGNVNQVTLSVASGSRQRRMNRRDIVNRIRNDFVKPEYISIHWDTKLVK